MLDPVQVLQVVERALKNREMLIVVGDCYVEYSGRASSKLAPGSRMLLVKGDGSFAIHQNRYLRPVNYMMDSCISCRREGKALEFLASKLKPKESLKVVFTCIDFIHNFLMHDTQDIRLVGNEEQLSKLLAENLSFVEPGLKPLKQEVPFKKGVVDIIAEDSEGRIVIVEVKRRKATLDAVSQLHRYREQLKNAKHREVRGILLAPDITENALALIHSYGLEFHELDFAIEGSKAKIKGLERSQTKLC